MHQSIPAAPRSPHPPHQGKINGIHVFKSNYTCLIVYQCINQFQLRPGPPPHPIRVKSMAYNYVFKSNYYTCLIVYQCISQFQLCPAPPHPPQQGKLNGIHCTLMSKIITPGICQPRGYSHYSQAFDGRNWNWLMQNFIHLFMWQLFHLMLSYFRLMLMLL